MNIRVDFSPASADTKCKRYACQKCLDGEATRIRGAVYRMLLLRVSEARTDSVNDA